MKETPWIVKRKKFHADEIFPRKCKKKPHKNEPKTPNHVSPPAQLTNSA